MLRSDSAVSSVVGVVLLLLLVVLAASVIGLTLSAATQNAVESTPNVQFIPSADPQMLYHGGGDVLYKDRLKFYDNGVDITGLTQIDGGDAWTEWRTGQAIELPDDYYVANLTIIALDTLGRDQLLYRGSGVVVTPVPTPTPTTSTPTVTPTPTPTPSPYYVVGSEPYANASEFVDSLNAWKEGTADLVGNGNSLLLFRDIIVGNEPIVLTPEIMGSDNILYITDGWSQIYKKNGKDNITISRAPGYAGTLLVIETGTLSSNTVQIVLDGTNQVGSAPLLVIENGATLSINEVLTVVNGIKEGGEGGGIYNAGTLRVQSNLILANNNAEYGGGIFVDDEGSVTMTGGSIARNYATVKGGGVYNKGSYTLYSGTIDETNTAPTGSVYYAVAGSTNNRAIFMRFAPGQQTTTPTVDQAVDLYLPYWG